jgi:hypothetical protein
MCECGCYGAAGQYRLPGPGKGKWYRIIVSPPCKDCDTGGGIVIELAQEGVDGYDPDFDEKLPMGRYGALFACGMNAEQWKKKITVASFEGLDMAEADCVELFVEDTLFDAQGSPRLIH